MQRVGMTRKIRSSIVHQPIDDNSFSEVFEPQDDSKRLSWRVCILIIVSISALCWTLIFSL
jgi:hypothetical protein